MRPKDLVMDLFGDYIRYMGGSIRLSQLTHLLTLFDVEPSTARVTLSRMRKEGWVRTERNGRQMTYFATPQLLRVLDEGRERIFGPSQRPWPGQWTMVLYQIPESRRQQRESLKRMLTWEGFGQLNPTTWISPRDIREKIRESLDEASEGNVEGSVHVVTMSTGNWTRDRQLAHQCWDLDNLASDYRRFIDTWSPSPLHGADHADLSPESALISRVKLIWDYRHFPFKDPGLPTALQPEGWPGGQAHELFLQRHSELTAEANSYMSSVLTGHEGRTS